MGQVISSRKCRQSSSHNQKLLEHHRGKRVCLQFQKSKSAFSFDFGQKDVKEPSHSVTKKLNSHQLAPLCVSMLNAGVTHSTRKLVVRICAEGIHTGGCYFVGEDIFGLMVQVGVYDKLLNSQDQARQHFPVGRMIQIDEPYFKRAADGTLFIRVDNKADLTFDPQVNFPNDAASWKTQGNDFWKTQPRCPSSVTAAKKCWETGLTIVSKSASVLLSNRAETRLRLGDFSGAVVDAAAAVALDSTYDKAAFKLVQAYTRWQQAVSRTNTGASSTASSLASMMARRHPALSRNKFIRSLRQRSQSDLSRLWWEEPDFIQVLHKMASPPTLLSHHETWTDIKSEANKNFGLQRFQLACDGYTRALQCLGDCNLLVPALCNLSLANLETTECLPMAVAAATVAAVLRPSATKAWMRRALAMERLGRIDEALSSYAAARATSPSTCGALSAIEKRLRAQAKARSTAARENDKDPRFRSTRELTEDNLLAESMQATPKSSISNLLSHQQMLCMLPEATQMHLFGRKLKRLPDFCDEFLKHGGGWPAGVSAREGREYLFRCYTNASCLPYSMEVYYRLPSRTLPEPNWLIKRLGNNHPHCFNWLMSNPPLGSIRPEIPALYNAYADYKRHDFSNSVHASVALHAGTTHVAIGFVDLGMLLVADLQDGPKGSPLSFVGYDSSAYAVAKTLVIWQMLRDKAVDARVITQVWFSVGWAKSTQKAFREAVGTLRGCAQYAGAERRVQQILDHWEASGGVALSTARAEWAQTKIIHEHSFISHMLHRRDRLALARYELSGDFGLGGEHATCGSIAMFDCPDGTPPPSMDATVFSCLDFAHIIGERRADTDVMAAAENLCLKRVLRLATWAAGGRVTVTLRCQRVEQAVADIWRLSPRTMSWSNVLDYMHPTEFHKLAHACSKGHGTTHFGYSMNWVSRVFGANLLDFELGTDKNKTAALIKQADAGIAELYKKLRWDEYLWLPIPQNPINTVGMWVAKQYHQHWTKHFFSHTQTTGCTEFHHKPAPLGPLAATGADNINLTWKY